MTKEKNGKMLQVLKVNFIATIIIIPAVIVIMNVGITCIIIEIYTKLETPIGENMVF